jgi:uncharacterized damage-inducible protein DinB
MTTKSTFYINLYTRDLSRIIGELNAYQDEENIWKVLPGTLNSAGHLIQHLIGNLKTYIGNPLAGIAYVRNRDAEFTVRSFTKAQFLDALNEVIQIINTALQDKTDEELATIYSGTDLFISADQTIDVVLLHLLAHLSYHLGQINYQRRYFQS